MGPEAQREEQRGVTRRRGEAPTGGVIGGDVRGGSLSTRGAGGPRRPNAAGGATQGSRVCVRSRWGEHEERLRCWAGLSVEGRETATGRERERTGLRCWRQGADRPVRSELGPRERKSGPPGLGWGEGKWAMVRFECWFSFPFLFSFLF